jgi:tripartite-type tricarboxylate transporter receptor subunit TctC
MRRMRSALCGLAATAALLASPLIAGQPYPSKAVKIIVAFPPGAVTDTTARLLATPLTAALGQPVIVENRPGASGIIGTEAALRAPADGYTLTMISSAYTTAPTAQKVNFDPIGDITPIIQISREPLVVVATPALPVRDIRELVAHAKANPGKLNFASAGAGTPSHLAAELFSTRAGIRMHHVPYKGGGPAFTDLIAGQTDVFFVPMPSALPHARAGKLRALAVASRERNGAEPQIPTVAESGIDYEVLFWVGIAGPKGMPRPIVERLNSEVATALKSRETGDRLRAHGSSIAGGTPEQFHAMIRSEIELWRGVAREANLQPE